MKLSDYLTTIAPKALYYSGCRRGWLPAINPLTLTFSVTAACQSGCITCNIGRRYLANPKLAKQDLSLEEIERVFKSLGPIYFFNVSGGEPFMRGDLAEIVRLACIHLRPRLIHIPTNAIAPRFIVKTTRKILAYMNEYCSPSVPISIKPSVDGVGKMHDYVRGYQGNFERLEETVNALLNLREENPRLHVDLGTVVSNYNLHHLDEIEDWVHSLGIGSYRHEIAEQRAEFYNLGDPITPSVADYETVTQRFKDKIVENIHGKSLVTRLTEAVRLVYYDVAVDILKQRRQVTPCYGGISNIHLNYDGEIWPCCVLGDEYSLGNVRQLDYDVRKLLRSVQARKARRYIADGKCACPLNNQWLNNILLTPRHMVKVISTLFFFFRSSSRRTVDDPPAHFVATQGVEVDITGTAPRKALVFQKFGTIPDEEEVDLPVFGGDAK